MKKQKKEKDLGLEDLPYDNIVNREPGQRSFNVPMKQRPSDRKNIHPTVKPIKLMAYLVTLGSRPGDIVLDPFCGSGTTCLAASILGRRFLGIEIEKKYFLIAKERLTNITGVVKEAVTKKSIAPKMKSLSDIESITLRYHDKSVFDMKAVAGLMTVAFHNPEAGVSIHDNVEITTVLKPEDTYSKPDLEKNIPVHSIKEKDNVQDWADKTINIAKGCSNDCRYCYAREEAIRFKRVKKEDWSTEILNQEKIKKGWRFTKKNLMFPSTHDITPGTFDACATVLEKVLKAGNTVLVVSKPRPDLIEKLCDALEPYKDQMMFRFTISARNNEILSFWESNAPCYEDRVDSLIIAYAKGFRTSVSIEPMLDPGDIKGLVEDLRPYTKDSMWIGPVKMIRKRTRIDSEEIEKEVQKIEAGQTPGKLLDVYNLYKNDPLIKWKGHFRKLLMKIGVEVPEQKDDWRDHIKN